jgi:hypothetical protein
MRGWFYPFLFFNLLWLGIQAQQFQTDIDLKLSGFENDLSSCQTISDSSNYGKRTLYLHDQQALITVSTVDNGFKKKVRWFFENDSLIYCDQHWSDPKNDRTIDLQHYYLKNNRLVLWLDTDNKPVPETTDNYIKMNRELPAFATGLLKRMKS